jgi:hypothetical protein
VKIADLGAVFDDSRFPKLGELAHPERVSVLDVRSMLTSAVADGAFLADCIGLELALMESDTPRRGLVPFYTIPGLGIEFSFGYWRPGATPGPHEHSAWTVTAVCRNRLEVVTFDRNESHRRGELVPKNHFDALAGRVGYIYEPCIHQPTNTSVDWSVSLHVTSPRDGEVTDDAYRLWHSTQTPSPAPQAPVHPYWHVVRARQRHAYIQQLVRILVTINEPEVNELLDRCLPLASPETRRTIQAAPGRDRRRAPSEPPSLLTRVHRDLTLAQRDAGDMVALDVETPDGPRGQLLLSDRARDAVTYAVRTPVFDVRSLPGTLAPDERLAVADALERTGLFRRLWP